jgi:plasmid stabilization system protein ParE
MLPELNLEQIREIIETNYRIIYYVGIDTIDILAVVHGQQKLSSYYSKFRSSPPQVW